MPRERLANPVAHSVYALIRSLSLKPPRQVSGTACDDRPHTARPVSTARPAHHFVSNRGKTMFKNKWLAGAALAGLLAVSGVAQAASVSFVQPADGASVSNPVHVVFAVDGMKIAPAGTMTEGTGHHHLLIDGQPLPKGEVIPATDKSLHFGKGQT